MLSKLKLDRAPEISLFHLQNFKSGKICLVRFGWNQNTPQTAKSQLECSILEDMELNLLEGFGAPKTDVKRFEIL